MATPVGHALLGVLIHGLSARNRQELANPARALGLAVAAVAADLDLALRWLDGRNHHQAEMHSLGAALIVAGVIWCLARLRGSQSAWRGAALAGLAWLSHPALDFLSEDTNPPFGPMILWPVSRAHFISPLPLFLDTRRALSWDAVHHNLLALSLELAILIPVVATAGVWRWHAVRGRGRELLARADPDGRGA
jgi:hypothetical protein